MVLASICMSISYIIDPTMAETYAAWNAVFFGRDLGIRNVIMEGDALKIIHAFQTKDQLLQRYGTLIEDTKIVLHSFQHS